MPTSINTTRRQPLRALGITALGATAALALAGCAGSDVPALEDVWPEAHASIEEATSVAIDGSVNQGGQDMTVAISGQIDDSSYSGNVAMGEVAVEILGNDEYTYMKPNTAFYEENGGGAQLQEMVGDKWLEMPAEQGGFTMSTLWDAFTEDIPSSDEFSDSEYTSETVDLNGEEVYKYTGSTEDSDDPVSLYVSKDNKLVRVEAEAASSDDESASPSASSDSSSGAGTIDFSEWDAVETVEMPAEDTIFSIPGL